MLQSTQPPLYTPDRRMAEQSLLKQYMNWLFVKKGLYFRDYNDLWDWSVTDLENFWESIWQFFDVQSYTPYQQVVLKPAPPAMIGTEWFAGATLNYAEHIFRHRNPHRPAIVFPSERSDIRWSRLTALSWAELEQQVAAVAAYLRQQGVGVGDRVVAVLPDSPEAVVAFLATNSIGAIWSICHPDFSTAGLIDRFRRLEPTVLIAADGYLKNGLLIDTTNVIHALRADLPTLRQVVWVPYAAADSKNDSRIDQTLWPDVLNTPAPDALVFEPVPFNHPIWVQYSSGATGKPKALAYSVGGCLLEHLNVLTLHQDVRVGDMCFWQSATGPAMWPFAIGTLLAGATLVLHDGAAGSIDPNVLWRLADEARITHFGAETGYFLTCLKAGLQPAAIHKLAHLRTITSVGASLPPEGSRWVNESVKKNAWLISVYTSTDAGSVLAGGNPLLPVYEGESQCRLLGCKLDVFSDDGLPLRGEPGELVIREPMPSMPLYLWDDRREPLAGAEPPRTETYHRMYFGAYQGVWRLGDYGCLTERNGVIRYGRSDATLIRDGVRIGTDVLYTAVEGLSAIANSLVVGLEQPGSPYFMPLFVVLNDGFMLTDELVARISSLLRDQFGTSHVPDAVYAINEVPYTFDGEKLETPVRKILSGTDASLAVNAAIVRNPAALNQFAEFTIER